MPTLYRDTGFTLNHLVEDIELGRIALPDIQRPFVWSPAKVRDLFDSMYRGYPVGTLMFWETGAEKGIRRVGGGEADRVPSLLIVDGQQRLTSLYAVMTGEPILTKKFEKRRIRIAFKPATATFEVTDAAIERDPEFISDISILWTPDYRAEERAWLNRLSDARDEPLSEADKDPLRERIDRVHDLTNFRFQVIELAGSAQEEQVADVFVRINSEGVQLNQADFILTLLSVHWEEGRRNLEAFAQSAVDPAVTGPSAKNPFIDPSPDQMLRAAVGLAFRRGRLQHVYSVLRGKDLETGEVSQERRDAQFAELETAQAFVLNLTNWHEFLKSVATAGFRSRHMITSANALIFTYILWSIGKRDFAVPPKRLRSIIAQWFFMAHTTGRYTSSPESQIESDLARLRDLKPGDADSFCQELERIIGSNFTADYWNITLPARLETSSSRSPTLFAYWAALNILDAQVLFSQERIRTLMDPVLHAPRSVERHHLFPKKHLASIGVTATPKVNAIANMAFLDWQDNAEIGADDPRAYWPAMTQNMDEPFLKDQRYWHALPLGWEQLDYDVFLDRRRTLMAHVIRDGFAVLSTSKDRNLVPDSIGDLIAVGESQNVEFKSTARLNLHTREADKRMEHAVLKTAAGFLNTGGGTLIIGVDDAGSALGLDQDLATLKRKANLDGFELFLRDMLDTNLSVPTAGIVDIRFEEYDHKTICVVTATPSGKPVFTKNRDGSQGHTDFHVRIGNATKQLHGDDMLHYQANHWNG